MTRPRASATFSGCSVGLRVTTGIWSLDTLSWNRLFRLFQVDHLGDQPAAVDDVPELFIAENNSDRVFGRVDLPGPVQVSHDLDHGEEFDSGTLGDVAQSQAVADSALKADRRDAPTVADWRRAGLRCQDLDPQSRGPLEPDDLDPGVKCGRTLRAVSFRRDDRANRGDTGPNVRAWGWSSHWHSWRDAGRRLLGGPLGRSTRRGGYCGRRSRILGPGAFRSGYRDQA